MTPSVRNALVPFNYSLFVCTLRIRRRDEIKKRARKKERKKEKWAEEIWSLTDGGIVRDEIGPDETLAGCQR